MPAAEAMACGCPPLAARAGALPEVVGNAGLLFNPTQPAELVDAVERLLDEPSLRDRLGEAGLKRAALFSPRQCAELTMDVYRCALDQ